MNKSDCQVGQKSKICEKGTVIEKPRSKLQLEQRPLQWCVREEMDCIAPASFTHPHGSPTDFECLSASDYGGKIDCIALASFTHPHTSHAHLRSLPCTRETISTALSAGPTPSFRKRASRGFGKGCWPRKPSRCC